MAASSSIATSVSTDQMAFGQPADLPVSVLPTELDIAKCFLHEKQKWMIENSAKKDPDNSIIAEIVVSKVESVYKRASIPTVRKDTIKARVLKVYEKRQRIIRIPAARRYKTPQCPNPYDLSDFFKNKKYVFLKGISCLFEVVDNENVPNTEYEFLKDQRSIRKMTISSTVEKEATRKQHQKESSKQRKPGLHRNEND